MSALENLPADRQDTVRREVRALLERTEAFGQLSPEKRAEVAKGLVDVVAFLADPAAGQRDLSAVAAELDGAAPRAEAAADAKKTGFDKLTDRLADKQKLVGADFKAGGMEAGTRAFKELVSAVDFPKFVSGLVEGVFTSIVDSSIRQMEAYGKLLEGVVKSVEQFANDNITQNNGRDYLASKFPDKLTLNVTNGQPRLALANGVDEAGLEPIKQSLGMKENIDLDSEESEAALIQRARLEMARTRQQQLATMVLLGINRIVVTDGLINAKVVFDVKASDEARRTNRASMYDNRDKTTTSHDDGGWFSNSFTDTTEKHRTTIQSATDDTSESKAQLKANLTGEVRVNFKSETFPLNQMASSGQIATLGERAKK